MLSDLVVLSRPKHWIKNVFVFMPVPFALASGAVLDSAVFVLGLLGFCLLNSAVYAFNDVVDAERDKVHERKRQRPVASGRVSPKLALAWSLTLAVVGLGVGVAVGKPQVIVVFCAYLAINGFYCLRGRRIPLIDVFLLSSGFVLRVLLGCVLVAVAPSNWLLLCSWSLALFLSLAKRRADIVKGVDDSHRPSLAGYNEGYLEQAIGITAAMTLIAYSLYCIEAEVLIGGREFATLPFAVFGVLEYLRRVRVLGIGDSPVDQVLSSPTLILCGLGWVVATLWSVALS